jgi:hypothetical protein
MADEGGRSLPAIAEAMALGVLTGDSVIRRSDWPDTAQQAGGQ